MAVRMKLERKPNRLMDYDQHDFDGWRQLCVVKTGMGLKNENMENWQYKAKKRSKKK